MRMDACDTAPAPYTVGMLKSGSLCFHVHSWVEGRKFFMKEISVWRRNKTLMAILIAIFFFRY